MSEITFTKKDVRDYLMANPEAEHETREPAGCVLSNFFFDREGQRYSVCDYGAPGLWDDYGVRIAELPPWAGDVMQAFDRLGFDRRFASWEVLAALDPILKDES